MNPLQIILGVLRNINILKRSGGILPEAQAHLLEITLGLHLARRTRLGC